VSFDADRTRAGLKLLDPQVSRHEVAQAVQEAELEAARLQGLQGLARCRRSGACPPFELGLQGLLLGLERGHALAERRYDRSLVDGVREARGEAHGGHCGCCLRGAWLSSRQLPQEVRPARPAGGARGHCSGCGRKRQGSCGCDPPCLEGCVDGLGCGSGEDQGDVLSAFPLEVLDRELQLVRHVFAAPGGYGPGEDRSARLGRCDLARGLGDGGHDEGGPAWGRRVQAEQGEGGRLDGC